jgi:hypothetical protein
VKQQQMMPPPQPPMPQDDDQESDMPGGKGAASKFFVINPVDLKCLKLSIDGLLGLIFVTFYLLA